MLTYEFHELECEITILPTISSIEMLTRLIDLPFILLQVCVSAVSSIDAITKGNPVLQGNSAIEVELDVDYGSDASGADVSGVDIFGVKVR